MNRVLAIFLLAVFTLLIEPLLLEIIPFLGTTSPEFALITILYIAHGVKGSLARGAAASLGLGYLMDLYTGAPIGMHAFVFVLLYFLARLISAKIYGISLITQALFGAVFSVLCGLIIISLEKWLNPVHHSWVLLEYIPKQALVTGLFSPVYFYIIWKLDRLVSYETSPEGVFK
ncbi:MAG: rod shape-determining protein MreD [Deltaproteobacteria bacterium]|jgi:rod shape-determining protein MreD|nr:rod shape-determining protein MreD [Deltaproteobacteria bacterium]